MSGKVARRLRKIAEHQFKADGGKYGLFHISRHQTIINAYKNYYRGLKALYKQGRFTLT